MCISHPKQLSARQIRNHSNAIEILNRVGTLLTPESVEYGASFQPYASDIIINTYPKCGTTWTGYICHMLRSNGNISTFSSMEELMPWIPAAYDNGIDLNQESTIESDCNSNNNNNNNNNNSKLAFNPNYNNAIYSPRIFMSHSTYDLINKGGKYIYVMRDPCYSLLSFHKFLTLYYLQSCDVDEYVRDLFFNPDWLCGTPYDNMLSWLDCIENGDKYNTLTLFYEDLHENRKACVEKIYHFMEMDKYLDSKADINKEDLINKVYDMSSHKYMSQIDDKFRFGETFAQWIRKRHDLREKYFDKDGKSKDGSGNDIYFASISNCRKNGGKTGNAKNVLSDQLIQKCNEQWIQQMKERTNTDNYHQFREKHSFLKQ